MNRTKSSAEKQGSARFSKPTEQHPVAAAPFNVRDVRSQRWSVAGIEAAVRQGTRPSGGGFGAYQHTEPDDHPQWQRQIRCVPKRSRGESYGCHGSTRYRKGFPRDGSEQLREGDDFPDRGLLGNPRHVVSIQNRADRDQPQMLIAEPETAGLVLEPGHYAFVFKGMGFDFTVAGDITSPDQCLERVDAANGAFYSPCPARQRVR